ncbi:MAG: hypothetical protein ACP5QT_00545 [Brevinematia bacterium]
MKKCGCLLFFIEILLFGTWLYPVNGELRSTAVIGFINTGSDSEAYFNTMLTKSLITTLEALPGADIRLYPEIEVLANEEGFWKQKVLEKRMALRLGQRLLVKQIITGEYRKVKDELSLVIYVYDVVTEDILFKKNYNLSTSLEFFENIDSIGKEILGLILGKNVEFGRLTIQLTNTSEPYTLYIIWKVCLLIL